MTSYLAAFVVSGNFGGLVHYFLQLSPPLKVQIALCTIWSCFIPCQTEWYWHPCLRESTDRATFLKSDMFLQCQIKLLFDRPVWLKGCCCCVASQCRIQMDLVSPRQEHKCWKLKQSYSTEKSMKNICDSHKIRLLNSFLLSTPESRKIKTTSLH